MVFNALKSEPKVAIKTNVPVPNFDGEDRQIDVLIEHEVASIPMKVAIEYKDYSSRIPAEKIEASAGKCSHLPDIHRKVIMYPIK